MAIFIGSFENKMDRKGRVSVPATFRQILAAQSFAGIVTFPSPRAAAIDASSLEFLERADANMSSFELYSKRHDDFSITILGESYSLPFDPEGRVTLPPALVEHAGIHERAAFVGKGKVFQIWEPDALQREKAQARSWMPACSTSAGGSVTRPSGSKGREKESAKIVKAKSSCCSENKSKLDMLLFSRSMKSMPLASMAAAR